MTGGLSARHSPTSMRESKQNNTVNDFANIMNNQISLKNTPDILSFEVSTGNSRSPDLNIAGKVFQVEETLAWKNENQWIWETMLKIWFTGDGTATES